MAKTIKEKFSQLRRVSEKVLRPVQAKAGRALKSKQQRKSGDYQMINKKTLMAGASAVAIFAAQWLAGVEN